MRDLRLPIGFFLLLVPYLSFAATDNSQTTPSAITTPPSATLSTTDDPFNMAKSKPTSNSTDDDTPDMPDTPNTNTLDGD